METSSQLSAVPTWRGSLDNGWKIMTENFLRLFLVVLVLVLVDAPLEAFKGLADGERTLYRVYFEIMVLAYMFLFAPVIDYSADLLFVQSARREKIEMKNIIIGFNNFLNIILANLLVTALVAIGLIALIVPGIIVACRLVFVSYLIMDKGLDPIAATETSWKLTRGYGWTIFGLGVTSVFLFIAGLIFFIVGVIPAIMWIKSTFASLYEAILQEKGDDIIPMVSPDPAT